MVSGNDAAHHHPLPDAIRQCPLWAIPRFQAKRLGDGLRSLN